MKLVASPGMFSWAATRYAMLGAALTACAPGLPDPSVDEVSPDWGYNGEETEILVVGKEFFPQVRVSGSEDFEFDRDFRAWLVDPVGAATELDYVELTSWSSIEATVPEGLDPNRYDLRVMSPTGATAELSRAFEVRDTRASAIVATTDRAINTAGEQTVVELQLVDPDGEPVLQSIEVDVELSDASFAQDFDLSLVSLISDLAYERPLTRSDGIRGTLDPSGQGRIYVSSPLPADLILEVGPSDEELGLDQAELRLSFEAGQASSVQLLLPGEGEETFHTVAGRAFDLVLQLVDEGGNPTEGKSLDVLLWEDCQGEEADWLTVVDRKVLQIAARHASEQRGCDLATFSARYRDAVEPVVSSGFVVAPASAERFLVEVDGSAVVEAGHDELPVAILVADPFDNYVTDYEAGSLRLRDTLGGLDPTTYGAYECDDFVGGSTECRAVLWVAGVDNRITVEDGKIAGSSGTFTVVATDAATVIVDASAGTGTIEAGQSFETRVRVLDGFGNPIPLDLGGGDSLLFEDGTGGLSCVLKGPASPLHTLAFDCATTEAGDDRVVTVDVLSRGVSGESNIFDVINAELAVVSVQLGGRTEVTAGESLVFTFEATDAWGNAYIHQSDATLSLSNRSGGVSPTSVELGTSGKVTTSLVFTVATEDEVLSVAHNGSVAGSSAAFDVVAGALDHLSVELSTTWVYEDSSLTASLTATDVYGNPVTNYEGPAVLSSDSSLGEDVTVDDWVAGEAAATFTFDEAGLQDTLSLDDSDLSATSSAIDVVRSDCSAGPTAQLEVDGDTTAVLCLDTTGKATATFDGTGSSAGDATLAAWHFYAGKGAWSRSSSGSAPAQWVQAGGFMAQALVVDQDACGSLATAKVYVAPDDGSAAGEIGLSLSDDTLSAGSSTAGKATATLTATTCDGDPVLGGTLYVRSDLGELSSGGSTVSGSGAGLAVTTDSTGSTAGTATITWSMASESYTGTATLHAGVQSGGAHGTAEATVSDDAAAPTVLWVDPVGSLASNTDEVVVEFSEDMRSASLAGAVALYDGDGAEVLIDSLSLDGSTLTIVTVAELQLEQTDYLLEITSAAHDSAGNSLDGSWAGSASDFTVALGLVVDDSVDLSTCVMSPKAFRPDGDDGAGSESDSTTLSLTASAAPSWWELEVIDSDGDTVLLTRQATTVATDTWSWDGRNQEGLVVANGTYTVLVSGLDTAWNAGSTCTTTVLVDNKVRPVGG